MSKLPDGFKMVYQGGHHNVYCNGKQHVWTYGGKCWPDQPPVVKRRGECDCATWTKNDRGAA